MDARKRLLHAMETCLESMPIDDIRVGNIAAEADVSRQTFYRLYTDKFDLLEDFYKTVVVSLYRDETSPDAVYDATHKSLVYFQSHVNIAKHMFLSKDMYSLESFFRNLCYESDMKLWRAQGIDVDNVEINGAIRFYAYGTTAFLLQWIKDGCPGDVGSIAAQFILALPVCVISLEEAERLVAERRHS